MLKKYSREIFSNEHTTEENNGISIVNKTHNLTIGEQVSLLIQGKAIPQGGVVEAQGVYDEPEAIEYYMSTGQLPAGRKKSDTYFEQFDRAKMLKERNKIMLQEEIEKQNQEEKNEQDRQLLSRDSISNNSTTEETTE